jgi:hypothetical protein
MVTNLGFYFTTQKEVRGGKFVWWGDTNPTLKKGQLLGGDLLNPKKGFDHFYAGQLGKYVPGGGLSEDQEGITIYRAFAPKAAATDSTTIILNATGWDDAPEVGMIVMVAPDTATTTGQSAKITAVEYDKENEKFTVTVDTALTVAATDILVEAKGEEASAKATPLVDYVNMWILADKDLMPTDGFGIKNGHYYLSGVSGCAAYIGRMQPLAKYILAQNKSLIDGVFEL